MTTSNRTPGDGLWSPTTYWDNALATGNDVRVQYGGENFAASLTTAHDYLSLIFSKGYSGNVGVSGASLTCDVDRTNTGDMQVLSSGAWFYHQCTATSTKVNKLTWAPANSACRGVLGQGIYTTVAASSGLLTFKAAANPVNLYVMGADVILEYDGSNLPTLIEVSSGSLTIQRDFTAMKVTSKGVVIYQAKGITGGTVEMSGQRFDWRDGSLGDFTHKGGIWDQSRIATAGLSVGNIESFAGALEIQALGSYAPSTGTRTKRGLGATIATAGAIGGDI